MARSPFPIAHGREWAFAIQQRSSWRTKFRTLPIVAAERELRVPLAVESELDASFAGERASAACVPAAQRSAPQARSARCRALSSPRSSAR